MIKNALCEAVDANSRFTIIFGDKISCRLWGENWGVVSSYLRNNFCGNEVECDLSYCVSADPFALMNIILDIKDICLIKKHKVCFTIPNLALTRSDSIKAGTFLKFLATQGFLDSILEFAKLRYPYPYSHYNINNIGKFCSYKYKLDFSGEVIFPFKIYNLENKKRDEIVNDVLSILNPRLRKSISMYTWKRMKEQIYNAICELVDNSLLHAYESNRNKLIAIYIRRRKGLSSISDMNSHRNSIKSELGREIDNCPGLDQRIFSETSSFLELFFCDLGMGLTGSLKEYFRDNDKEFDYPVRELYRKVLRDGIRRDYSSSVTPFGGLHFICRIVNECKGYIWCAEGKEWVGAFTNELLGDYSKVVESSGLTLNTDGLYPLGLNWCFRIPFYKQTKEKNNYSEEWTGLPEMHPVYLAYKSNQDESKNINIVCIDDIHGEYIVYDDVGNPTVKSKLVDIPQLSSDYSVVWFPNGNSTKNSSFHRIEENINTISSKFKRPDFRFDFIIADIEVGRLFSFFYSINEQTLKGTSFRHVNRIILISKSWDVVVFSCKDDKYLPNQEMGKNYIANDYNGSDIAYSLQNFTHFIRRYDTRLFWNLISQRKRDNLYINASINWKVSMPPINGFLDLERACLYPDIYKVIENTLYRLGGIVYNNALEYRAVDQTAKRICQGLNSKRIIENNNKTYVDVCGVSVTGYSFEAAYTDSRSSIRVLLFSHPASPDENNYATVFLWHDEQFLESFERKNTIYYRLGKTSLISTNCDEARIDVNSAYRNIVKNKNEMYKDFQEEIPEVLRYGHYKTDSHHYLIGFDVISYMKYSYLRKNGAFVYVLWTILYYLLGEDFLDKLDGAVDDDWKYVLRNSKFYKNSNHGSLVLYHSNTHTEYVMRKINSLISTELQDKIIPLSIYELQDKGNPLTFSPLMLEKIRSIFDETDARGILFFDSSFSTGRRITEIENILLSTKCKKVTFLSLMDMRRLRNSDSKCSSYWKVNIPRLDDDGHCVICESIKELSGIQQYLCQEYRERIDEWIINWSSMNINNALPDHGIENETDLSCDFSGIDISNSVALNLIVAEKISESYSNDIAIRYTQEKTDLSPMLRMQLLCTQLIMFGQQNSRQLQINLLSQIVKIMSQAVDKNSYTSLAGLVIVMQNKSVIYDFLNLVLSGETTVIENIRTHLLSSRNLDLQLAFAYHVIRSNKVEHLLNGYAKSSNSQSPFIDSINEMIILKKDLKSIFKEFEGIYINEYGENHSTNWNKLIKEKFKPYSRFEVRCYQVINDMHQLCRLVKEMPSALMNSMGTAILDISKLDTLMRELEIEMQENLVYARANSEIGESEGYYRTNAVADTMTKLDAFFEQVINLYYISFSERAKKYFEDKIKYYETRYDKRIVMRITALDDFEEGNNKLYFWNQSIEKEFLYLIQNIEHSETQFEQDGLCGDMFVHIDFKYDELLITITSISSVSPSLVEESFMNKNRLSKEQTFMFDVDYMFNGERYDDEECNFVLNVKMKIPACYQRLRGE